MRRFCLVALLAGTGVAPAAAQSSTELAQIPLEQLLRVDVQNVFGASERLQPVTEAPASVTIVTADEIARFGSRSLADVLRSVRGFYVTDDRNYSYLGARGFARAGDYNTRILLLVNGHRINDNVDDQAPLGGELGMDPETFARVEIIRGPASSLVELRTSADLSEPPAPSMRVVVKAELYGTAANVLDQRYADLASDEHAFDAIEQNGRTARAGRR